MQYPGAMKRWHENWDVITPFFVLKSLSHISGLGKYAVIKYIKSVSQLTTMWMYSVLTENPNTKQLGNGLCPLIHQISVSPHVCFCGTR